MTTVDLKKEKKVFEDLVYESNRLREFAAHELRMIPEECFSPDCKPILNWVKKATEQISGNEFVFDHAAWIERKWTLQKKVGNLVMASIDNPKDEGLERNAYAACALDEVLQSMFMPSARSIMSLCGFVRAMSPNGEEEILRQLADLRKMKKELQ
jgi:hypothetical protein